MKSVLKGWNFFRLIRLVLGVIILIQGIGTIETFTIILGAAIVGTTLANIGCCGTNRCAVNTPRIK